jgi:nucleoside-diphosphate-sugar epimerase
MKVFIAGATGYVGSHVARHLRRNGHDVVGLCRSAEGTAALQAVGVTPLLSKLDDPADAVQAAEAADATIFAARLGLAEQGIVTAFLNGLASKGKTFIFTSGTGVVSQRTGGDWSPDSFAEDDAFVPNRATAQRAETERNVRNSVTRGIRGIVMRPPLIWGNGAGNHHIATAYESFARTGCVCYIGRGLNVFSNVHVDDLAEAYRLALERGVPGALYHTVAGEIPNRWISESVARDLGCATRSVDMTEAIEIWGKFRALMVLGVNSRSRDPRARAELGWAPTHLDLLAEVGHPALRARVERASAT